MAERLAIFDATPASYAGGYEHFADSLGAAATQSGWECAVVRPSSRAFLRVVRLLGLGARFAHIAQDQSPSENLGFLRSATRIYVKNEPLDIFWLNTLANGAQRTIGFHTPLAYPGTSWLVRLRNRLYDNALYRGLLGDAKLHFLSGADARIVTSGGTRNQYAIIPNGIKMAAFETIDLPQAFTLLFVGRMTEQKGLDRLTWLAGEQGWPPIDCIGDGPMRESLERDFGVAAKFCGTRSRDEVLTALRQHSVLLMPSRWEGLPLVMLEAMSVGCVPLISEIQAMVQVLPPDLRWLSVDFSSKTEVLSTLRRLRSISESASEWSALRMSLVQRVRDAYSERTQMNDLLHFIGKN